MVDGVSTNSEIAENNAEVVNANEICEEYRYGMKNRGYSIGCQPMRGLLRREDDETNEYLDIIVYDRELSIEEITQYELEYIDNN